VRRKLHIRSNYSLAAYRRYCSLRVEKLVERNPDFIYEEGGKECRLSNTAAELGVIGVIAYFEAFCKHQFAALVHCCPSLLIEFGKRRPQASISIRDLATVGERYSDGIGYVVAEHFDFGSSKGTNGLFFDLLEISVFSSDEMKRMDAFLNKRHLLVHHSGIITQKYALENKCQITPRGGVFQDSVEITGIHFQEVANFFRTLGRKIAEQTCKKLEQALERNPEFAPNARLDALPYLLWDSRESGKQF
jgi:hypothetical protein